MNRNLKVSAPGKLILSGEHAVVYGYPAIATAINRRIVVNEDGVIESNIPIGAGMGSSAAFAVTISALKIGKLDLENINEMAYGLEKGLHGNPSGVDNTVVTYGGFLWYRKESEDFKTFESITPKISLPNIFLLDSGRPNESTKEMVSYVAGKLSKNKKSVEEIFRNIEVVTRGFLKFLLGENGEEFGTLIRENQRLLETLGIVGKKTSEIIKHIEKEGGSAKVSGAGGIKNGSGMVLVYHNDAEKIKFIAKKYGLSFSPIKLGEDGIRIENKRYC